jgi:hypothetical protein
MFSESDLKRFIELKNIRYFDLISNDGSSILIAPSLGGRIIGVFVDSFNLVWVNPNIGKDWNSGGHRTWYAPEWGSKSIYAKGDHSTWSVPGIMDPGNYCIIDHKKDILIEMQNDFEVTATDGTSYFLTFKRKIELPWVDKFHLPDNFNGKKIEIEFTHSVRNRGKETIENDIGLWSILQIVPPGKILIPLNDENSQVWFTDKYYEKVPPDRIQRTGKITVVSVDGARRYKLGFPPDKVKGEIAYLSELPNGRYYLIMKFFEVFPNSIYVDKPYGDDKIKNGDAIQIYNHSEGGGMAFAELEAHAPASILKYNDIQTFSIRFIFLVFAKNELQRVFDHILDIGSYANLDGITDL